MKRNARILLCRDLPLRPLALPRYLREINPLWVRRFDALRALSVMRLDYQR